MGEGRGGSKYEYRLFKDEYNISTVAIKVVNNNVISTAFQQSPLVTFGLP